MISQMCPKYPIYLKVWKWSCSILSNFVAPWTVAYQAPLSMIFSRQECWSGLPFPFPGYLPHPGIEPGSLSFQADALPSEPPGNSLFIIVPVYLPKFSPNYLFTPKWIPEKNFCFVCKSLRVILLKFFNLLFSIRASSHFYF